MPHAPTDLHPHLVPFPHAALTHIDTRLASLQPPAHSTVPQLQPVQHPTANHIAHPGSSQTSGPVSHHSHAMQQNGSEDTGAGFTGSTTTCGDQRVLLNLRGAQVGAVLGRGGTHITQIRQVDSSLPLIIHPIKVDWMLLQTLRRK